MWLYNFGKFYKLSKNFWRALYARVTHHYEEDLILEAGAQESTGGDDQDEDPENDDIDGEARDEVPQLHVPVQRDLVQGGDNLVLKQVVRVGPHDDPYCH